MSNFRFNARKLEPTNSYSFEVQDFKYAVVCDETKVMAVFKDKEDAFRFMNNKNISSNVNCLVWEII